MCARPSLTDLSALFTPAEPSRWTLAYRQQIIDRANRRIAVLSDRLDGVTDGRVLPDGDQVTIGSGRHMRLCIFFLDICGFSSWPNWTPDQQKRVLAVMNIFMAEMMNIARDFGGSFEKNTGDGLMAYFGEGASTDEDRVRPAVEAAVVMMHVNDTLIAPYFAHEGLPVVRFRIGIDLGPVTIARVGVAGGLNSIVAIGTPANIACKLMNLVPDGGICIGKDVYDNLPFGWLLSSHRTASSSGFIYTLSGAPYEAFVMNHRLSFPTRP